MFTSRSEEIIESFSSRKVEKNANTESKSVSIPIGSVTVTSHGWFGSSSSTHYPITQNIEISIVDQPEEPPKEGLLCKLTKEEKEILLKQMKLWYPILRGEPYFRTFQDLLNAGNSAKFKETCLKLFDRSHEKSLFHYRDICFCIDTKDASNRFWGQQLSAKLNPSDTTQRLSVFAYKYDDDDSNHSDLKEHARARAINALTIVKNIAEQYRKYKEQNTTAIYDEFYKVNGVFLHHDQKLNEYGKSLYMNAGNIDFSRSLILNCALNEAEQAKTKLEKFMDTHFRGHAAKTFDVLTLLNYKKETVGYAVRFKSPDLFNNYIKINKKNQEVLPEKIVIYNTKNNNKPVNYCVPSNIEKLTENKDFEQFLIKLKLLKNPQSVEQNAFRKQIIRVLSFEFSNILKQEIKETISFNFLKPEHEANVELKLPLIQKIYRTYKAVEYIHQNLEEHGKNMYVYEDKAKGKFYLRTAYEKLSEEAAKQRVNTLKTGMACTKFSDQPEERPPIGIKVEYGRKAGEEYETQLVYIYIELNEKRFTSLSGEYKPNSTELVFKDYKTEKKSLDEKALNAYLQDIESGAIEKIKQPTSFYK